MARSNLFPVLIASVGLWVACGESPTVPVEPGPTTGTIVVSVSTSGVDVDPDGYFLTVDGRFNRDISVDDQQTLTNLTAGPHSVGLRDVEVNCAPAQNPQAVTVTPAGTAGVSFDVACSGVADSTGITTTDLGQMPGSVDRTSPSAISDDGAIAGNAGFGGTTRAFYRSPGGAWVDLSAVAEATLGPNRTYEASDLSDDHRVAGTADGFTPTELPIVWEEDGSWSVVALPLEREGFRALKGHAWGISDRGVVVVGTVTPECTPDCSLQPALWSEKSPGVWQLELLPTGGAGGVAVAVSDGPPLRVVGEVDFQTVLWTRMGEQWGLPVRLPGPDNSDAFGVNNRGDVAGRLFFNLGTSCPVLWKSVGAGWDLIVLTDSLLECPSPGHFGQAHDVNDAGHVVGSLALSGLRPFLWSAGRLQLLRADGFAEAINEAGQFVGQGGEDFQSAFLWTIR